MPSKFYRSPSPLVLRLISVSLLSLTLTGCLTSGEQPVDTSGIVRRDLPDQPSYAKSAIVAPLRVGEPLILYTAREKAARLADERVITAYGSWAKLVRGCYANSRC